MICELCTADVQLGVMFRVRLNASNVWLCASCRQAVGASEIVYLRDGEIDIPPPLKKEK